MSTPTMYAGYPHLYLPGNPKAAERFVEACIAYGGDVLERLSAGWRMADQVRLAFRFHGPSVSW